MDLQRKEKRNDLRMKYQNSASPVSRSFSCLLISRQSLVSVAGCLSSVWQAGQGFRAEYAQPRLRKIQPETALPPDLSAAIRAIRYLCIRASGTGGWRDEPQLYHRLLPLLQETSNVIGVALLVAQISVIANRLNNALSLLRTLNATAIIISML